MWSLTLLGLLPVGLAITLVALRERHGEVVTVRSAFVLPDRRLDVCFLDLVKGFGQGAFLHWLGERRAHLDLRRPAHAWELTGGHQVEPKGCMHYRQAVYRPSCRKVAPVLGLRPASPPYAQVCKSVKSPVGWLARSALALHHPQPAPARRLTPHGRVQLQEYEPGQRRQLLPRGINPRSVVAQRAVARSANQRGEDLLCRCAGPLGDIIMCR